MSLIAAINNNTVEFDDYVETTEDGITTAWANVCIKCATEHGIPGEMLSDCASSDTCCCIKGCNRSADFYIDFNDCITTDKEDAE